jgi:asparagine synthase (glutamine-hydrolysing)
VAKILNGVDTRFANRVKNFVERGSKPNPDRFYSDDSFASDHFSDLLTEAFRSRIERDESLDVQRSIFRSAQADCSLHRLMYLDLKMTIADNDVVKVVRAAKLAGVEVVFPYLDRDLVDYTGHLPGTDKVRGLRKRYLFKQATLEILPEAIREKKKQGFGLPVSVWLRRGGPFHSMVRDIVLSDRAIGRGYYQPGFLRHLMDRHERGAWDHASELYMLLMLELWHREYIDPRD